MESIRLSCQRAKAFNKKQFTEVPEIGYAQEHLEKGQFVHWQTSSAIQKIEEFVYYI